MDRQALQHRLETALALCGTTSCDDVVRRMRIHRILVGVHFYLQGDELAPIPRHVHAYESQVYEEVKTSGVMVDEKTYERGLSAAIRAGLEEEQQSPSHHGRACTNALCAMGYLLKLKSQYGFSTDHFKTHQPPGDDRTIKEYTDYLKRIFHPLEHEWKRRQQENVQ